MYGVFFWWKPCQCIASDVPAIMFITSTKIKSPWQTWIEGPGIFRLMLMTPRSIPSAVTHCSLKQWVTFAPDKPQVPQALLIKNLSFINLDDDKKIFYLRSKNVVMLKIPFKMANHRHCIISARSIAKFPWRFQVFCMWLNMKVFIFKSIWT